MLLSSWEVGSVVNPPLPSGIANSNCGVGSVFWTGLADRFLELFGFLIGDMLSRQVRLLVLHLLSGDLYRRFLVLVSIRAGDLVGSDEEDDDDELSVISFIRVMRVGIFARLLTMSGDFIRCGDRLRAWGGGVNCLGRSLDKRRFEGS